MMSDRTQFLDCYQLNSGNVTRSLRAEIGDEIIALMAPLLQSGTRRMLPPMDDYECRITVSGHNLLATICCDQRPCMAMGVAVEAASANVLWEEIEDLFRSLPVVAGKTNAQTSEVRQPSKTPWCVGLLVQATKDEADWMEDFTRCLAWAWVMRATSTTT